MHVQFQKANPTENLYATDFEAASRTSLMKYCCDHGYVRIDQATPTKNSLLRIIEDKIVVVDTNKISRDDQPTPLNTAHEAHKVPFIEPDSADDLMGDLSESEVTQDAQAQWNAFSSMSNAFAVRKKFSETFPDEPAFGNKSKVADVKNRVKELLGIE